MAITTGALYGMGIGELPLRGGHRPGQCLCKSGRLRHRAIMKRIFIILLSILGLGMAGCADEAATTKEAVTEFYEEFRGKKIDDLQVKPSFIGAADFFTSEPEGLRITLPAREI